MTLWQGSLGAREATECQGAGRYRPQPVPGEEYAAGNHVTSGPLGPTDAPLPA